MTALEQYLVKLIRVQGPLSMAAYMAEALGNKTHGYYMKQNPFGRAGDFITAPEISQMFGEIIGLWQAGNWLNMGSPDKVHLIELGPGRGSLMQDALRAMEIVPDLIEALEVHLVEMSPFLKKTQEDKLAEYKNISWHGRLSDALDDADGAPVLLIANEFFDALPTRQFQKTDTGWHERLVALDGREKLALQLAPVAASEALIPPALHRADMDSIAEICPVGENIMAEIADYIKDHGGAALVIDYGHDRHGSGDTLQALKNHQYVNILSDPGDCDLTIHVNFQRFREIALSQGAKVHGPVIQGQFLSAMGIAARARGLSGKATDKQQKDIETALRRLTDKDQMGQLFKVMAITDHALPGVVGFGV